MSSDSTVSDSGVVTSGVSDVATTERISRTDSEHTSSSEEILGEGHIPPPPPPPPNSPNLPRHRPPSPPRPLPHQEGLKGDMQEFNTWVWCVHREQRMDERTAFELLVQSCPMNPDGPPPKRARRHQLCGEQERHCYDRSLDGC